MWRFLKRNHSLRIKISILKIDLKKFDINIVSEIAWIVQFFSKLYKSMKYQGFSLKLQTTIQHPIRFIYHFHFDSDIHGVEMNLICATIKYHCYWRFTRIADARQGRLDNHIQDHVPRIFMIDRFLRPTIRITDAFVPICLKRRKCYFAK